jgi:hypothetical protein
MTTDVIIVNDLETVVVDNTPISVIITQDDTSTPDIVVVTEAETILVDDSQVDTILTIEQETQVITQGAQGPIGPTGPKGDTGESMSISAAPDVDVSYLQDGSLLIFSSQQQKWVANTQLTNQSLESGHY